MFLRLLLAFVSFAVFAAVLVGGALYPANAKDWFWDFVRDAGPAIFLAGLVAIGPAYFFARAFVRPLREIREGAERVAGGEYEYHVHGGAFRESRLLANSFNDMSQRLAWQINRLESEREQLKAILGGMVEGVVAVGAGQRVLFANEAAGTMLAFNPATAFGRAFWEVCREPGVQALLEQATPGRQPVREKLEIKAPVARHLSVYVAAIDDAQSPGAIMVLQDTSDLRRLERMRHDFVANVSHELKTPLAVIKACAETLIDGAVDEPEMRGTFLNQIADQGERLNLLIMDLLSLARIESGEEAFTYEPVNVGLIVASSIERHGPRAEQKQSKLVAVPPAKGTDAVAWADEEAFYQILDNLVDNAVKYTPEGSTIRINWNVFSNSVELRVSDNGQGIPSRDLPRIFERFYRVDKARSRELGGTGLGLAIVKHLTQAMGGSILAESEVGRGTSFTVTLPKALDK
jgi:two-component system, OmpR family, phosphate regulon sensor histidine kinase PhoR